MENQQGFKARDFALVALFIFLFAAIVSADFVETFTYYPVGNVMTTSGDVYGDSTFVTNDSLAAFYPFDGDSVADYSGMHNDAVKRGSARGVLVNSDSEYVGTASVKFNYTAGTDSGWLRINDAFGSMYNNHIGYLRAAVRLDAVPADTAALFSFCDTNADEYLRVLIDSTGIVRAALNDAGTMQWDLRTDDAAFSGSASYVILHLVQNSTEPVLYVNGRAVDQTFQTSTDKTDWFASLAGVDSAYIGTQRFHSLGYDHFINGLVDEVVLSRDTLTATEVWQDYQTISAFNSRHDDVNFTDYYYFTLDPGYDTHRRTFDLLSLYGNMEFQVRAKDSTNQPSMRVWFEGKDTTDGNSWNLISDTAEIATITESFQDDTLSGYIDTSAVGSLPAQLRMGMKSDSANQMIVRIKDDSYWEARYKTTE